MPPRAARVKRGSIRSKAPKLWAERFAWLPLPAAATAGLLWSTLCLVLVARSVQAMPSESWQLFLVYFQPFFPPLLMAWLWALALSHWQDLGADVAACFGDAAHLLPSSAIAYDLASAVTAAVATGAAAFAASAAAIRGPTETAYHVPLAHPVFASLLPFAVLLFPLDVLHRRARMGFLRTLARVLAPVSPVNFADFLLADILTSLAKSIADAERALCRFTVHRSQALLDPLDPRWGSPDDVCLNSAWGIAMALALPSLLRLVQCLWMHAQGHAHQLANALKYASALPVIFLSSAKFHVTADAWHGGLLQLWVLSAVVNSAFSIFWDVKRDWGLLPPPDSLPGALPPPRPASVAQMLVASRPTMFRQTWVYLLATVSNAAMRILWLFKLAPHLRSDPVVLSTSGAIECLRRWQWLYFRMEHEMIKVGVLTLDPHDGGRGIDVRRLLDEAAAAAEAGLEEGKGHKRGARAHAPAAEGGRVLSDS